MALKVSMSAGGFIKWNVLIRNWWVFNRFLNVAVLGCEIRAVDFWGEKSINRFYQK